MRSEVNYSKKIIRLSLEELLYPVWCTVEYIQLTENVYTMKQKGKSAVMWGKDLKDEVLMFSNCLTVVQVTEKIGNV